MEGGGARPLLDNVQKINAFFLMSSLSCFFIQIFFKLFILSCWSTVGGWVKAIWTISDLEQIF